MKKAVVLLTAIFTLFLGITSSLGQPVSEEAKRHFDYGMAAVEMAKSPGDYAAAIKEFEQAARLAPDWSAIYYNLGLVQEKAGQLKDAADDLKTYLKLAPNASDAEAVKTLINKLEYKMEQILPIPDIVDVLASFNGAGWQLFLRDDSGVLKKMEGKLGWLDITRVDNNSIRFNHARAVKGQGQEDCYTTESIHGSVIKLHMDCSYLDRKSIVLKRDMRDLEIEVISRNLVKIHDTSSTKYYWDSPAVNISEAYWEFRNKR